MEQTPEMNDRSTEDVERILRQVRDTARNPTLRKPPAIPEQEKSPIQSFSTHRKWTGRVVVAAKRAILTLFWKTLGQEALVREARILHLLEQHSLLLESLLSVTDRHEHIVARVRGRMDRLLSDFPPETWTSLETPSGLPEYRDRLRGDDNYLRSVAIEHLSFFEGQSPVLDIGCGRGTFLALLKEHGLTAYGIDCDPQEVARSLDRGVKAEKSDAISHLIRLNSGSLGGVYCSHVLEHLSGQEIQDVLSLCFDRLRPGGRMVLETPNPVPLMVLSQDFYRDPFHQRPLHPEGMKALLEGIGFVDVMVVGQSPFSPEEKLPDPPANASPHHKALVDALNARLYGYRAYALRAQKP